MATVTPNFNWPVPTSTDLVKDGATAIEALGDSIDASLLDLKGGTTGQVLSKTTNTDMDFTWVTTDDANAIQNSIVDAKGDLISATANDTPARLAVGANGETLVADSSTSTGLRYTAGTVQGNPILNSAFQIWQRGTSVAGSGSAYNYTADRWQTNASSAITVSRQATSDTTNLPFVQYCARVQRNSGSTSTTVPILAQSIETINSVQFAGKTVTFSFYARKGANYSDASSQITAYLITGTGTDQNVLVGGYTGNSALIVQTPTLTTTWQRFTYTATVATNASEIGIEFFYTPTGTAGAADFFEVTGVQIDVGSVALPFRTYAATIQGELAACQRYFQKSYIQSATVPTNGTNSGAVYAISGNAANSNVINRVSLPVVMRTLPTVVIYSYTTSQISRVSDGGGADLTASSGVAIAQGDAAFTVQNTSGGTITAAYGGFLFHYSASAEL
jgi:hypothetical protein